MTPGVHDGNLAELIKGAVAFCLTLYHQSRQLCRYHQVIVGHVCEHWMSHLCCSSLVNSPKEHGILKLELCSTLVPYAQCGTMQHSCSICSVRQQYLLKRLYSSNTSTICLFSIRSQCFCTLSESCWLVADQSMGIPYVMGAREPSMYTSVTGSTRCCVGMGGNSSKGQGSRSMYVD